MPFKGPIKLPTRGEVLCLYFSFREVPELVKSTQAFVADLVTQQVVRYWQMAPIQTMGLSWVKKKILKLVKEYEARRKSKNKEKCSIEAFKVKEFQNSLKLLFDIASPQAEDNITKDRLLVKKNDKGERVMKNRDDDLKFLEDQRGPRKGSMQGLYKVYVQKAAEKENRKKKEVIS